MKKTIKRHWVLILICVFTTIMLSVTGYAAPSTWIDFTTEGFTNGQPPAISTGWYGSKDNVTFKATPAPPTTPSPTAAPVAISTVNAVNTQDGVAFQNIVGSDSIAYKRLMTWGGINCTIDSYIMMEFDMTVNGALKTGYYQFNFYKLGDAYINIGLTGDATNGYKPFVNWKDLGSYYGNPITVGQTYTFKVLFTTVKGLGDKIEMKAYPKGSEEPTGWQGGVYPTKDATSIYDAFGLVATMGGSQNVMNFKMYRLPAEDVLPASVEVTLKTANAVNLYIPQGDDSSSYSPFNTVQVKKSSGAAVWPGLEAVRWSIVNPKEGVFIDTSTGELSVSRIALPGTMVEVVATSQISSSVASVPITLNCIDPILFEDFQFKVNGENKVNLQAGILSAEVKVKNLTGSDRFATLIMALYKKGADGKASLKSVGFTPQDQLVSANTESLLQVSVPEGSIPIGEDASNYYVKVFFWGDLETQSQYSDTKTITINGIQ